MKVLIVFILITVACAFLFISYRQEKADADFKKQIENLKAQKDQVIKFDSLRLLIESRVYDSVAVRLNSQDLKIKSLEGDLKKERKQNEQINKRLNSIAVSLPQF